MKRFLLLILCLAVLLPCCGCTSGKADAEFTAVLPGNVTSLDPQTATGDAAQIVIGSLFEGLCRIDENSEAAPGVASRWESNRDYTEFTFHLRDARWDNGEPVTADDFVFGIQRALNPATGASELYDVFLIKNARAYYNGEASAEDLGVKATDERTLVVTLEHGYQDFPLLTAGNRFMPCNREYFEDSAGHYGLSAGYVLSNGPFTFPHSYAWDTDYNERKLSLVRSSTYRGERSTVPQSLVYLIDYDSTVDASPLEALESKASDILPVTEEQAREAEERDYQVLAVEDGVMGLLLNPQCDALRYATTREIFLKTIDRESLLSLGKTEYNEEAPGVMAQCVRWGKKSYYEESPACYVEQDDGAAAAIPSLLTTLELDAMPAITVLCADDERSIEIANGLLISWNGKLGSAFNILPLPAAELADRVESGDYQAALYTLRAGGATPLDVLNRFASSLSQPVVESAEYAEALDGLDFTLTGFQQAEAVLREQYVFYPLLSARSYYALAPGVTEVTVSPDGRIDFSQGRKK